jgi:hypothetical protein
METMENNRNTEPGIYGGEEESRIKQKLGAIGRRIKRVDLRSQITDHPFAAIGIAAGVGAIIGLARPMPQRGRVSGALMAVLSTIGFRLVREAAITQLASYAKQQFGGPNVRGGMSAQAPQAGL